MSSDDTWQYTIEEKVIERAYKKLALDALVIQQGRLAEQKSETFVSAYVFSNWSLLFLYKMPTFNLFMVFSG